MVYLFRSILKQHTEKSFLRLSKINAVHKVCIYGILFVQVNFEATHWKIISKAPEIRIPCLTIISAMGGDTVFAF